MYSTGEEQRSFPSLRLGLVSFILGSGSSFGAEAKLCAETRVSHRICASATKQNSQSAKKKKIPRLPQRTGLPEHDQGQASAASPGGLILTGSDCALRGRISAGGEAQGPQHAQTSGTVP